METHKVAMDGAAWLAPSILKKDRDEFINDELAGIAFRKDTDAIRREKLGQVWDIAAEMEGCKTIDISVPAKKKKK